MQTDVELLLDKCSFVDPRFKQLYSLEDEPVKQVTSEMEAVVIELDPIGSSETDSDPPAARKGKFSKISGTTFSFSNSVTTSQSERVMKEIEMYIQYSWLHIDKYPLEWWKAEAS